jgi:hypothetical protein
MTERDIKADRQRLADEQAEHELALEHLDRWRATQRLTSLRNENEETN